MILSAVVNQLSIERNNMSNNYTDPYSASDELDAIASLIETMRDTLMRAIDMRSVNVTEDVISSLITIDEQIADIFHSTWESNWRDVFGSSPRDFEAVEISQGRDFPSMFPHDLTVDGYKVMEKARLAEAMKKRRVATNPATYQQTGGGL